MNIINFLQELDRHYVIGIVGDLGDGKTITGVSLLILLDKLYEMVGQKKTILTNVPIACDHELLEHYNQLEDRKETLIFIDELYANMKKITDEASWITGHTLIVDGGTTFK